MNLTNATKQEVTDYLDENNIEVFESDSDGDDVYWGCSMSSGFSTFDVPMTEVQAQFAAYIFHQLVNKYNVFFGDAEKLAQAYVNTDGHRIGYTVRKQMTEKEQEQVRQQLLNAIESGNVGFAGENNNDYE